jgi:hypothetical protein
MKQAMKQMFTGRDNITVDAVRVLAVAAVVEALALTAYVVVWRAEHFDMQTFGIGLAAIFASVGIALKLKAETEPSDSVSITTKTETNVTETSK